MFNGKTRLVGTGRTMAQVGLSFTRIAVESKCPFTRIAVEGKCRILITMLKENRLIGNTPLARF